MDRNNRGASHARPMVGNCARTCLGFPQKCARCSPAHPAPSETVPGDNGIERSDPEHRSMPTTTSGTDMSDFAFHAIAGPSATGSEFGTTERSVEHLIPALGQQIRVRVRAGSGVPLVLCNGIGASLEVLDPLVDQLDPDTTVVRFDVPGVGGSPDSMLPYTFPYLAAVLGRLMSALGLGGEGVDVLGLSWGGALAQQFAFQNPRRCRRLILASTGVGIGMVPAAPAVLAKLLSPQRFIDPDYAAGLAGELYGGGARAGGSPLQSPFDPPPK